MDYGMRRLLTVLLLVLLLTVAVKAHADTLGLADVYILCNTQKYANDSLFSKELSTVLAALEKEASSARYDSSMSGTVMGFYQCRGDLPQDVCSQCVSQATQSALDSCPNAIGSRVQLDGCFVRYENYTFMIEDSSVVVELCNTHKFNTTAVESHVTRLLSHVITAAPKSNRLYASAASSIPANVSSSSSSTTLYALAQCLAYLSPAECSNCLAAHNASWHDCDNAVGAQVHSVSCYYRYEIYPFFYQE